IALRVTSALHLLAVVPGPSYTRSPGNPPCRSTRSFDLNYNLIPLSTTVRLSPGGGNEATRRQSCPLRRNSDAYRPFHEESLLGFTGTSLAVDHQCPFCKNDFISL